MSFGGVIVVKLSGVIVREPSVIVMGSNSALPKKGKAVSYNQHGFAWFSQPKKGLSIRFILKFVGSMHIGYISLHLLNICGHIYMSKHLIWPQKHSKRWFDTYFVIWTPTLSLARNVKNLGNSLCDTDRQNKISNVSYTAVIYLSGNHCVFTEDSKLT